MDLRTDEPAILSAPTCHLGSCVRTGACTGLHWAVQRRLFSATTLNKTSRPLGFRPQRSTSQREAPEAGAFPASRRTRRGPSGCLRGPSFGMRGGLSTAPESRICAGAGTHLCGQTCGQDVKELCRISETMHKILSRYRNFVLSLILIQASISLHARAPNGGRCSPPEGLRSLGTQLERLWISRSGETRVAAVSGSFGSRKPVAGGLRAKRHRFAAFGPGTKAFESPLGGSRKPEAQRQSSGMGGFFGSNSFGTGGRVALQFLTIGLGGVGQILHRHLPAMAAPLPRVGELASPGSQSVSRGFAKVSRPKAVRLRTGGRQRGTLPGGRFSETGVRRCRSAVPADREDLFGGRPPPG